MTLVAGPAALAVLNTRIDVFARKHDGKIWRTASYDNAQNWQQPWTELGPPPYEGVTSGLASVEDQTYGLACAGSGEGRVIHLCSRATKLPGATARALFWHQRTDDFTRNWTEWQAIGAGTFTSAAAMAASGDGQKVVVVGRGQDKRMWFARSFNAGRTWNIAWAPISTARRTRPRCGATRRIGPNSGSSWIPAS